MENQFNDRDAQGANDQQGANREESMNPENRNDQSRPENSWSPGQEADRQSHPAFGDQDEKGQSPQSHGSWSQSAEQRDNINQNTYGRSTPEGQQNPDQQYSGSMAENQDRGLDRSGAGWEEDPNTESNQQSQRGGDPQQNYGSFTNQGVGGNVGNEYDAENQGHKSSDFSERKEDEETPGDV